ncbi:hypothetical protein [Mesorhizobium sp. B2-2-3]|uniref:hypothetical protein n=1 Tax=Mesorhizobium sp. B2-2-3 TaxID=2589963 RepID=UPI001FEE319A|nr:hypothetical protein [Mesorhizobium sp. B2-2-3]
MIGSFFSAASCFWQPAKSRTAVQVKSATPMEKIEKLEGLTDGGETDDVAFLLMGSLSRRPLADRDASRIPAR